MLFSISGKYMLSTRLFLSICLCGVLIAVITPWAAQAAIRVVDIDGQASATDCNASTAAFTTIQVAVNAAAPGDTISPHPAD